LYRIQLWWCAKNSNIKIIPTIPNKILGAMVNTPWYVRNLDIHRNFDILTKKEEIKWFGRKRKCRSSSAAEQSTSVLKTEENKTI
jgi:hypothetical protein